MITKGEVFILSKAMPPRYPKGDPRNERRKGPGARFGAALRRYKKEHGRSWFEDMKGDNQ